MSVWFISEKLIMNQSAVSLLQVVNKTRRDMESGMREFVNIYDENEH